MENSLSENKLQLVTKLQAINIKELGFDWPTQYYYNNLVEYSQGGYGYQDRVDGEIAAPEIQLVFKWLRENKNICCSYQYKIKNKKVVLSPLIYKHDYNSSFAIPLHFKNGTEIIESESVEFIENICLDFVLEYFLPF